MLFHLEIGHGVPLICSCAVDIKEINFVVCQTCVTILSERSGKDHRETEGPDMGAKVIIYGKAG
jgi:hypothetical protein